MTTTTMSTTVIEFGNEATGFNWIERLILRRSHPFAIMLETTALTWAVYLLWNGNWQAALGVAVLGRVLQLAVVRNVSPEAMAATALGRLGLLHLQPVNLSVQAIGAMAALWGVWIHDASFIGYGLTAIMLGHAFGWSKVSPAFALAPERRGTA